MADDYFYVINDQYSDVQLNAMCVKPRSQILFFDRLLVNDTDVLFTLQKGRYVLPRLGKSLGFHAGRLATITENLFLDALHLYVDAPEDDFIFVRRSDYVLLCEARDRLTVMPSVVQLSSNEYTRISPPSYYRKK